MNIAWIVCGIAALVYLLVKANSEVWMSTELKELARLAFFAGLLAFLLGGR